VQGPFYRTQGLKQRFKPLNPDFFFDFHLSFWYDEFVIGAVVESPQEAVS
jgi:hypothetical protein